MGKRKARDRYERKKRVFRGNQFVAVDVDETVAVYEHDPPQDDDKILLDTTSSFRKLRGRLLDSESSDSEVDDAEDDNDDPDDDADLSSFGNRVINLPALQKLLTSCSVCSRSKKGHMVLVETERHGLAPEVQLECDRCSASNVAVLAEKPIVEKARFYDINRKAVFAARMIGRGY